MQKIYDNIEELRKIINEDNFKKEEAFEFLEAVEENANGLIEDIDELKDEIKEKTKP